MPLRTLPEGMAVRGETILPREKLRYNAPMRVTVEDVLKQALTLDETDRASLAGALIDSLHEQEEPEVEEAWDTEVRRRVEELDAGAVITIPWSDVRKRLFSGFE